MMETSKTLKLVLTAVAVSYVILYVSVALCRMQYPFELEWMEGGSVDHVRRILSGEKLYVRPSLEFVPFVYPPLYFYVSAVVSEAVGVGFLPLRMVSFVSSLGCFLLIFLTVRRETGDSKAAFLSLSLFAATFRIGGAFFDIGRVDSLSLFLFLCAIYTLRFASSTFGYSTAGVLVFLSFLGKQTALIMFIPLALYSLTPGRRSLPFIVTAVVLVAGGTLLLDRIHDGWYSYYTFRLPASHEVAIKMVYNFWSVDLMTHLPIACMMSLFYLIHTAFSSRKDFLFYSTAAVGMLGGAWYSRLHVGGYDNVLMPAYAVVSILSGLAAHTLLGRTTAVLENKGRMIKIFVSSAVILQFMLLAAGTTVWLVYSKLGRVQENALLPAYAAVSLAFVLALYMLLAGKAAGRENKLKTLIYIACIVQFILLAYNPLDQLPSKKDLDAGRELIEKIRQTDGEVLVIRHGYLPAMAGKKTYAHDMAIYDVTRGDAVEYGPELDKEVRKAIGGRKFSALILDGGGAFQDTIDEYYEKKEPAFNTTDVFWPVTGMKTRPEWVYRPK